MSFPVSSFSTAAPELVLRQFHGPLCNQVCTIELLPIPSSRQVSPVSRPFGPSHLLQLALDRRRQVLVDGHQVISFTSRFWKPPLQELIERLQLLHPPVLSGTDFTQISFRAPQSGCLSRLPCAAPKRGSRLFFESTNSARRGLSFRQHGGISSN